MKLKILLVLFCILAVGFIVRAWQLNNIPPGLNVDEVSEGYNAYSLYKTGKDRYGMSFPITFKSYGSYQPPLYTYLTVLPVLLLGTTTLAVKIVTLLSGLVVIIFSFLIIKDFLNKKKALNYALFGVAIVSIAPWAIFFSRIGTEASLSLAIFVIAFYLSFKTLNDIRLFPLACLFLGLSTHAYYSERVISLLFLIAFTFLYRKWFWKNRMWLLSGFVVFGLTQIPHLAILQSGAFTRRLDQVSYLGIEAFKTNGVAFNNIPFGRAIFITREFLSQYLAYFSPRNLFFQPDDQGARAIPDLSVFYTWMILPWIVGFGYFIKNKKDDLVRTLLVLMAIAPIPAALSTDPFYTLRVFVLLWVFSIIIAFGSLLISEKVNNKPSRFAISLLVIVLSLFVFYTHYFVLFKHERGESVNFSNMELISITESRLDKHFVIDLSRDVALGMRFAYYRKYDPSEFQIDEGAPYLEKYYSSTDYEGEYTMHNVEIRPINWKIDVYKEQILVGDLLAISQTQVEEHKLKLEFEIKDLTGNIVLKGYATNPKEKCLPRAEQQNIHCRKWIN